MTYTDMMNLSLNQVLMRSLNTSITVAPAGPLAAGRRLVHPRAPSRSRSSPSPSFVGLLVGAYSSIFVAAPLVGGPQGARAPLRRRCASAWPSVDGRAAGADADAGRRHRRCAPPAPPVAGRGRRRRAGADVHSADHPPRPRKQAKQSASRRAPRSEAADAPLALTRMHAGAGVLARPHPGHPRLPRAGRHVQGHHPAAGRPRGLPARRRRAWPTRFADAGIDQVLGIEARGLHLRRAGRLPLRRRLRAGAQGRQAAVARSSARSTTSSTAPTCSRSTATPSRPGERVLIVDDVLATGGTAAATARLVERLGGEVVGFAFLIELGFLDGRDAARRARRSLSLLTYA